MKNKLSAIFYIALGFSVGYLLDTMRRNNEVQLSRSDEWASPNPIESTVVLESAPFTTQSSNAQEPESAEFLQAINGIGPAYAQRLFEGGIRSFAELAQMDSVELVKISKARSNSQVEEWIVQAAELSKR